MYGLHRSVFFRQYECTPSDVSLNEIGENICSYVNNYSKACYLEFGNKEGNFTPAFSMKLSPADWHGHVKIEVDLEINDNDTRAHRCCFYVNSELGLVEQMGKTLKRLAVEE